MNLSAQSLSTPVSYLRLIRRLQSDLRNSRETIVSLKEVDQNFQIWRTNTQQVLVQLQEQIDTIDSSGGGASQGAVDLLEQDVNTLDLALLAVGTRVTTAEGNVTGLGNRVTATESGITAAGEQIVSLQTQLDSVTGSIDSSQIKNTLDTCHIKVVDSNTLELKANGTVLGKVYQPIGQATTPLGVYTNDKLQFTSALGSYSFTKHGAQLAQPGLNVLGVYINQSEDFTKNQISQLSISNGQTLSLSTGHLNVGTGMKYYSSLSNTNEGPQQSLLLSGGTPETDPTIRLFTSAYATSSGQTIPIQFTGATGYSTTAAITTNNQFAHKKYVDDTKNSLVSMINGVSSTDADRYDYFYTNEFTPLFQGFQANSGSIAAAETNISQILTKNTTQDTRLTAIETKNTQQDTSTTQLQSSVSGLDTRVDTLENGGSGVTQAQLDNLIYASQNLQRYCGTVLAFVQQMEESGINCSKQWRKKDTSCGQPIDSTHDIRFVWQHHS